MAINYTNAVFAKRLADIRGNRELSQADLASMVGVSKDSVINWEQGRNTPRLDMACKLADALDCSITDLVHQFPATQSDAAAFSPELVNSWVEGLTAIRDESLGISSTDPMGA